MTILDEMLQRHGRNEQQATNQKEEEQPQKQPGGGCGCGCSIQPEEVNRVEVFGVSALTGETQAPVK